MESAMYKAAMNGDVDFLREVRNLEIETGCWNKLFLESLTPQKSNVIHVASQYDRYDFLKSGFDYYGFSPLMVAKRNANGDTPLHVASKRGNKKVVELLVDASNRFVSAAGGVGVTKERTREISVAAHEEGADQHGEEMPLRIKNKEGNTALHEALVNGKLNVATYLLESDPQLGNVVNDAQETPLHLAIKYNVDDDMKLAINTIELLNKQRASLPYSHRGSWLAKESLSIIELLLQKHNRDVYVRDNEGLTPLLRAAAQSHFLAIDMILSKYPECLEMCDLEGKTIMHLLKFKTYEEAKEFLIKHPQILNLKDQQDNHGNTPAHIAVMNCIEKMANKLKVFDEEQHKYGVMMKFESYEEAMKFTKMPQLLRLNGEQEEDTSASSPIAVMKCMKDMNEEQKILRDDDIVGVVRALFELSTNFCIKNKEGASAATLFQQLKAHFSCDEPYPELDMEIESLLTEQKLKGERKDFWKAVEEANVISLREQLDMLESYLRQRKLNISDLLYKLLQACVTKHSDEHDNERTNKVTCCYKDVEQLMLELFEKNPWLIYETNSQGDTPLHMMMVRVQDHEMIQMSESLLYQMKQYYENADQHEVYCPPWRVKNMKGNTPLHEALLHIAPENDGRMIKLLFEFEPYIFQKCGSDDVVGCDRDISAFLNSRNETPLHVFCCNEGNFAKMDLIQEIIEANRWALLNRDVEGLTPLLRAAKRGKIEIVKKMWEISPASAEVRDSEGRTFWHVMNMSNTTPSEEEELKKIVNQPKMKKIKALSSAEDNAGTTPLLQAIESRNYNLAQVLSKITKRSVKDMLTEERIGTRYTLFLLVVANYLPPQLEKILWRKMQKIGVKSIYGIPKSEINSYTNTMGVIAVLLATIAFTGAFAVPGGYEGNDGYPVLLNPNSTDHNLNKPMVQNLKIYSYWVFMVADILTMCLSIMVLFCLQWIVTGDDKDKLVITDLSIWLLGLAFCTTMVALMMGVFATTIQVSITMAILTVVMCSTVLLLLQKWIVMNALQYVFLALYLITEMIISWQCEKGREEKKSTTE